MDITFRSPQGPIERVTALLNSGFDGGLGEFDASCDELVKANFEDVEEWECVGVSADGAGRVTLHGVRLAFGGKSYG